MAGRNKAGEHPDAQDMPAKLRERIEAALDRADRDYLTVPQLAGSLPKRLRRILGVEGETKAGPVAERLRPFIGDGFRIRKGQRSLCLCRNLSDQELVRREAARKPGLSSKQLKNRLPLPESAFLPALNSLFQRGDLVCSLNREHKALIRPAEWTAQRPSAEPEPESILPRDREAFQRACQAVGGGRRFVRIHRIREHLQWPRERFDRVLAELRRSFAVQLHGGDPSTMTEGQIRDSYQDEQGRLYIALTWSDS